MPPKKNIITLLKDREYGDNYAIRNDANRRRIEYLEGQFNQQYPPPPPPPQVAPPPPQVAPVIIPEQVEVVELATQPQAPPQTFNQRNVGGRKTYDGRGGGGGGRGGGRGGGGGGGGAIGQ